MINPSLLSTKEFLAQQAKFTWLDQNDNKQTIELEKGQLAFTLCQTLFVYQKDADNIEIEVSFNDGKKLKIEDSRISAQIANNIFERTSLVTKVLVKLPNKTLLD